METSYSSLKIKTISPKVKVYGHSLSGSMT